MLNKASLLCLVTVSVISSSMVANAQETTAKSAAPTGFGWLKQFEGTWSGVSKSVATDNQPSMTQTATLTSRVLGEQWVINEMNGEVAGTKFTAIQSLSYDAEKKRYTGQWIDSIMNHAWHYEGTLDESGKKITLEAEGPDWTNPTKTRKYRDSYEFISKNEIAAVSQMMNDKGEWEVFMKGTMTKSDRGVPKTTVKPFLMFQGKALQAIDYYKTVFNDFKVVEMTKYGKGETGPEGTVKLATLEIAGQQVMCIDSPPVHDFTFTPSFSFFVECENEEQLKDRFEKLSKDGKVMMPLNNYGFSKQFGWTSDQFGVSWQLNLK